MEPIKLCRTLSPQHWDVASRMMAKEKLKSIEAGWCSSGWEYHISRETTASKNIFMETYYHGDCVRSEPAKIPKAKKCGCLTKKGKACRNKSFFAKCRFHTTAPY